MKRFMYLSIGVLCLMLAALIGFHIGNGAAIAQQDVISARGFQVINPDGQVLGTFSAANDTTAVLAIKYGRKEPVLVLGAGLVQFVDAAGATQVSMTPTGIAVYDDAGETRAVLHYSGLMIKDATGALRGAWTVYDDGSTALAILDSDQKNRAVLGTTSLVAPTTGKVEIAAESSLVLFDREGNVLARLP